MKKIIIPIKYILKLAFAFLLVIPFGGYAFFSLACFLLLKQITPLYVLLIGFVLCVIFFLLIINNKDPLWGIIITSDTITCHYEDKNRYCPPWTIRFSDIQRIEYDFSTEKNEKRQKQDIILVINEHHKKRILTNMYSHKQIHTISNEINRHIGKN